MTPILAAYQKDNLALVNRLLDMGAGRNETMRSLLEWAFDNHKSDLMTLILTSPHAHHFAKSSLIFVAIERERTEDVKLLLSLYPQFLISRGGNYNYTLLHVAARRGDAAILDHLLEFKHPDFHIDINATDSDTMTPLQNVVMSRHLCISDKIEIANKLIAKGALLPAHLSPATLLHYAYECNDLDLFTLIHASSDGRKAAQLPDQNGNLLIHQACNAKKFNFVLSSLAESPQLANIMDNKQRTVLDIAVETNLPLMLMIKLIEKGAKSNTENTRILVHHIQELLAATQSLSNILSKPIEQKRLADEQRRLADIEEKRLADEYSKSFLAKLTELAKRIVCSVIALMLLVMICTVEGWMVLILMISLIPKSNETNNKASSVDLFMQDAERTQANQILDYTLDLKASRETAIARLNAHAEVLTATLTSLTEFKLDPLKEEKIFSLTDANDSKPTPQLKINNTTPYTACELLTLHSSIFREPLSTPAIKEEKYPTNTMATGVKNALARN